MKQKRTKNMVTELKETVELMNSSDYKERFKAEYYQLKIRHDKLLNLCLKWDKGELDFIPTCSRDILETQLTVMDDYLGILETRAKIENIEL